MFSLSRVIADIPVYKEIDMVAIPYVQTLLSECIRNYFADLDVTHQGAGEADKPFQERFKNGFRLLSPEEAIEESVSKSRARRKA
jgi:hypothetical protein